MALRSSHAKGALVVIALVSLLTAVVAGSASGQNPAGGADRFTPISDEGVQTSQFTPFGVSSHQYLSSFGAWVTASTGTRGEDWS